MSTYWGYHCKRDDTYTDTWFNHGEHILRSYARCWPLLKQVFEQDTSGYIEVHTMAHEYADYTLQQFLWNHFDHEIELYNEYGATEPIEENKEDTTNANQQ